ncbi:MAG: hypothetical protein ACJ8AW_04900 [Rhodopila sp.]
MVLAKRALEVGGPPLIAAGLACLLQFLPQSLMDFIMAWTLLSLPVGVLVGHCALGEDENARKSL